MLAQDVGRCPHLKVVDEVVVRHEIVMPILDDVARVSEEEQRLGRAAGTAGCVLKCRLHVVPQRQDALLREVPAGLVKSDVELKRRGFVAADALLFRNGIDVDRVAVVVNTRVRERRTELWTKRQSVHDKPCRRRVLRQIWSADGSWHEPGVPSGKNDA